MSAEPKSVTLLAFKLWRLLTERGSRYSLGEITRDLGCSKTALNNAIAELEEAGLITDTFGGF